MLNKEKKKQWNREWIAKNRDRYNSSKYIYRDRLKLKVLQHYAIDGIVECAYCGFSDMDALCLDHIEDNGAEHRKQAHVSCRGIMNGFRIYEILVKDNYPKGLQILCANCNMKKEMERKRAYRMKNKWYVERLKNGTDTTYRHI